MNDFEIVFYQRANGECPVGDFLDSLNKVMRFKMMNKLDMLELYGNHPRGDYSKFVDEGIFELRAQTKTDITRIMFFFDENRKIVLTNGSSRRRRKCPCPNSNWRRSTVRTIYPAGRSWRAHRKARVSPPAPSGARSWTTLCPLQMPGAAPRSPVTLWPLTRTVKFSDFSQFPLDIMG